MSRRARFLTTISAALMAGAVAAAIVVASDGSGGSASASAKTKKAGFTPAKIAGKWTGTWQNTTFGSTGDLRVNVQSKPKNKLLFLIDFGGLVFGCNDPAAVSVTVPKAKKAPNRWDASGFRFANTPTEAFGSLSVYYNFKSKAFTASGSGPTCRPELKYSIEATLRPAGFSGNVNIDLGGGTTATAVLSAAKG